MPPHVCHLCATNARNRFGPSMQTRPAEPDHSSVIYYRQRHNFCLLPLLKTRYHSQQANTTQKGTSKIEIQNRVQNTGGKTLGAQGTHKHCDEGTHGAWWTWKQSAQTNKNKEEEANKQHVKPIKGRQIMKYGENNKARNCKVVKASQKIET